MLDEAAKPEQVPETVEEGKEEIKEKGATKKKS